jgi:uncharacterized membrane protein
MPALLVIGGLANNPTGPESECGSASSHVYSLISRLNRSGGCTAPLGPSLRLRGGSSRRRYNQARSTGRKGRLPMPSISPLSGTPVPERTMSQGRDPAGSTAGAVPPMTRNRPFGWLLVITGVVGWLASGTLVLEKLEVLKDPNHTTVCDVNPWISCGQVMQTWQSSLFGFPNMFIGIVAFAVIIAVGMALLAGATFARWYWLGLQAGVTLGFAFVVWLWSQALYSIHILCPFCMIVWAAMIPLFVWVTIRNITSGVIPVPANAARIVGDSGWIITALLYVAVIATIFFAFIQVFAGTSGF